MESHLPYQPQTQNSPSPSGVSTSYQDIENFRKQIEILKKCNEVQQQTINELSSTLNAFYNQCNLNPRNIFQQYYTYQNPLYNQAAALNMLQNIRQTPQN